MGKRTVTTEVQRLEREELYFCDDCGDPHDPDDLNNYRNGADVLHFCDGCERRFEETRAVVTGEAPATRWERFREWVYGLPVPRRAVVSGVLSGLGFSALSVSLAVGIFLIGLAVWYWLAALS